MSLLFLAGLALGATTSGAIALLRSRRERSRNERALRRKQEGNVVAKEAAIPGVPFVIEDVLVLRDGEELWLSSAIVLSESEPKYVIFFAPRKGAERWLLVTAFAPHRVVLLDPIELRTTPEPPTLLEVENAFFEQKRRLPLRVRSMGEPPILIGSEVLFFEYVTGGETLCLLKREKELHAARGRELLPGSYDHLPGASCDA